MATMPGAAGGGEHRQFGGVRSATRPYSTSRAPVTSQAGSGSAKPSRVVQPAGPAGAARSSASAAGARRTWRGRRRGLPASPAPPTSPAVTPVDRASSASAAASVRVRAPSLRIPARMWVSTVSAEMPSCPAMRRVGSPCGDQPQHVAFPVGELVAGAGAAGVAAHRVPAQGPAGPAEQHDQAGLLGELLGLQQRRDGPAGSLVVQAVRRAGSGPPRGGPGRARRPAAAANPPVAAGAAHAAQGRGDRRQRPVAGDAGGRRRRRRRRRRPSGR